MGGVETSINWEDDDQAIQFSLDDAMQSKHGLALLARARIDYEIERVQGKPTIWLSYERQELNNNQYHGNIVFAKDTRKRLLALLANSLGFSATHHSRPSP